LDDTGSHNNEALIRCIVFLACCHTIVIDQKKGTYNASSPDELALVNADKEFGFEFTAKDENDNIVIYDKIKKQTLKY
jgi:magnesium-transporting ATPase (P-type)